jgi:hypothetical protein
VANGFEGMDDLEESVRTLPAKVQKRIARAWARKWSAVAWAAAIQKAPIGKTRNLVSGIARRDTKAPTLRKLQSFARSVVIGRKPAYHFHLVNLGTKPRYTKGGTGRNKTTGRFVKVNAVQRAIGQRAYRGFMKKNDFVADAARPLIGQAESDLRTLVQRNIARFLRKGGS